MKTLVGFVAVIVMGFGVVFAALPDANTKTVKMLVTAYCPCKICCGKHANGETSLGDNAYVLDGVAADPKAIPYRTDLWIPGVGVKEVDDTGGAMRQSWKKMIYHIDLRFKDHQSALNWGRRWLNVQVRNN